MTQPSSNKHHEFPILYTWKPGLSSLHPYELGPEISTVSRAYKRGSQDILVQCWIDMPDPSTRGQKKPKKVAHTACMQKLLMIFVILRNRTTWQHKKPCKLV